MAPLVVQYMDPRLPLDLERTIFEMSALSQPCRIPNLMLVAQRVKTWVEPLMYRVVFLDGDPDVRAVDDLPRFGYRVFSRVLATKTPDFLRKSVKHLFLTNDRASEGAPPDEILRTCSQVVDLYDFRGISIVALDSLRYLRRIALDASVTFSTPSPSNFSHQVFRTVTHLELIEVAEQRNLAGIPHIPHLTHFAFNCAELCAYFSSSVLPACPRLKCIVLLDRAEMSELEPLLEDTRFVPMDQSNWTSDWQRGASGGFSYWDVADGFVRARQTGRVTSE
ncbi:hypothetical protein FB45DRAFT_1004830 [Roridomyces roridus]|uniref:Uncharacterized protein n=1 Tax=Roridomyces roridus TaxID=1738132 RepID=A0AAD7FM55_9AGAR|nr:hypothetical protein FB45DRAFT_1004830 [Roridomyces roridus]